MSPFQRKLSVLSRDRQFLFRGVIGILAVCVLLGFVAKKFSDREPTKEEKAEHVIANLIRYKSDDQKELADLLAGRGSPTPEAVASYIRFIKVFIEYNLVLHSGNPKGVKEAAPPLQFSYLAVEGYGESKNVFSSDAQQALFQDYAIGLYHEDPVEKGLAIKKLEQQAAADPPVRFANEFLGHISRDRDELDQAITLFEAELENFPRSDYSRLQILQSHIELDNSDELDVLMEETEYRRLVDWRFLVEVGVRTKSIGLITEGITRMEILRAKSPFMPLSVFTGLVWFIVLAKLGGVKRLKSSRLLVFALAVFAGLFSGIPTLVLMVWQEDILGFRENGRFVNDLLYCISNIALREELSKLLLFLPLIPLLLKRRSQIEMLIAGGCVGLGFAIMENVGYFQNHGPIALTRLLTASFVHITLTGLLGLALCRFCRWPKQCWEEFVGTFVAVVLLHGGYDAVLIVRQLQEQVGIFYIIFLVVMTRMFFKKAAEHREKFQQIISPLAVFVLGCALVVGISWIYSMMFIGLDKTLLGVGGGALGVAAIAFLFISELANE